MILSGKKYSTILTANGSVSGIEKKVVSFKEVDFCEGTSNKGDLELSVDNIKVTDGFGNRDNYWYLFDTVEIELRIENRGNWDMRDVQIDWELYTTDGKRIDHGDLSDFKLRYNDEETKTFTINLDRNIDDFESENAVLYVRAKGKIDDNDSPYDGNYTCSSDSNEVEVRSNEKQDRWRQTV